MPITSLQREILQVIARNRDPENFLAGGIPINRSGPRYSSDIDTFNDRAERVGVAAKADAERLTELGFAVTWLRELPTIVSAEVSKDGAKTKLEWVSDTDFRYFPAVADAEFGYMLALADLAANKVMAAVGRREPRDIIDLLTIHDRHLPLGAITWAAVEVAPGFTPEGLLSELRRNGRYLQADFRSLTMTRRGLAPIEGGRRKRRDIRRSHAEREGRAAVLEGRRARRAGSAKSVRVRRAPAAAAGPLAEFAGDIERHAGAIHR